MASLALSGISGISGISVRLVLVSEDAAGGLKSEVGNQLEEDGMVGGQGLLDLGMGDSGVSGWRLAGLR